MWIGWWVGGMLLIIVPAMLALGVWYAVPIYHAYCLLIPGIYGRSLRDSGLSRFPNRARWLVYSGGLLAAGFLVGPVVVDWLAWNSDSFHEYQNAARKAEPFWLFAVYSLFLNPIAEEVFWRGFVREKSGPIASSLLFGTLHWIPLMLILPDLYISYLAGCGSFVAGVLWSLIREKTGSLWPCVITHVAADAVILWIIYLLQMA